MSLDYEIKKIESGFNLEINDIATDKSISHRCAIFSLLSNKPSVIKGYLRAEDTLNSLEIACALGATKEWQADGTLIITPPDELKEPLNVLECGNSGTTIRLMSGFLAARDGFYVLTGDEYLRRRPMRRVLDPLKSVGAEIDGRQNGALAPIVIRGKKLEGIIYDSPIASAQIKSALILAALNAKGKSIISEPELTRDHTERMLKGMGADIKVGEKIEVMPQTKPFEPLNITVPSDPSSAFFFAVAAAITPNSKVVLKNLTLNPTRIEAYKVLEAMGAKISYELKEDKYEPIGDIVVEHKELKAVDVSERISWLIDEIPALSIAFACAHGKSSVKNAKELRVKESDRIGAVVKNLKEFGIEVDEFEDGFSVVGGKPQMATATSFGDHRIAMSFSILGLVSGSKVLDCAGVATSFPNFYEILSKITTTNAG